MYSNAMTNITSGIYRGRPMTGVQRLQDVAAEEVARQAGLYMPVNMNREIPGVPGVVTGDIRTYAGAVSDPGLADAMKASRARSVARTAEADRDWTERYLWHDAARGILYRDAPADESTIRMGDFENVRSLLGNKPAMKKFVNGARHGWARPHPTYLEDFMFPDERLSLVTPNKVTPEFRDFALRTLGCSEDYAYDFPLASILQIEHSMSPAAAQVALQELYRDYRAGQRA